MSEFLNGLPYTNFHELNASWFMRKVKEVLDMYGDVNVSVIELGAKVAELTEYVEHVFRDNFPAAVAEAMQQYVQDGSLAQWVQDWLSSSALKRSNCSVGTQAAIMRVVDSYMQHNNDLMYMHTRHSGDPAGIHNYGTDEEPEWESRGYGPFWIEYDIDQNKGCNASGTAWQTDTNSGVDRTGYAINCSEFVLSVLMGIPYECSRYTDPTAHPTVAIPGAGAAGYCVDPWNGDYSSENLQAHITTRDMFADLQASGRLEPINNALDNLGPGDVVFTNATGEARHTTHCGIVLAKTMTAPYDDEGHRRALYLIADCANTMFPVRILPYFYETDLYNLKNTWQYVAHLDYQTVPVQPSRLIVTADRAYNHMDITGSFHVGQVVTIEFDYTGSSRIDLYNGPEDTDHKWRLSAPIDCWNNTGTTHIKALVPLFSTAGNYFFNPLHPISNMTMSFSGEEITNVRVYDGLGEPGALEITVTPHEDAADESQIWEDIISGVMPHKDDVSKRTIPVLVKGTNGYDVDTGVHVGSPSLSGTVTLYRSSANALSDVNIYAELYAPALKIVLYSVATVQSGITSLTVGYVDYTDDFTLKIVS